ncbi:MAG: nucleotidyltransferase domain-containing protein, partial [Ideonella sp.]
GATMDLKSLQGVDVQRICRAHGIRRLALFGSRSKGTERPDSDVDLLVELEPDRVPGLMGISAIEIELGRALGLKVDLRTAQDLSPYFRDDVVRDAQLAYAA